MSFSVSPAVTFSEVDLTLVVSATALTVAAFAGVFAWGPVGEATQVTSSGDLIQSYGEPSNFNFETWFTAYNYLSYSNNLLISRAANTTNANGTLSAIANSVDLIGANTYYTIPNADVYEAEVTANGSFFTGQGANFIAKYPGSIGNSLRISQCDSVESYSSNINLLNVSHSNATANAVTANVTGTGITFVAGSNQAIIALANASGYTSTNTAAVATLLSTLIVPGDKLLAGNSTIGTQYLQVVNTTVSSNGSTGQANLLINFSTTFNLSGNVTQTVVQRYWEYFGLFSGPPTQSKYVANFGNTAANDELHIVVIDNGGLFTGIPGGVLEEWPFMSRAKDAMSMQGNSIYYVNVLNQGSEFVWFADDRSGANSALSAAVISSTNFVPEYLDFVFGQDGAPEATVAVGDIASAYNVFQDSSNVSISLVMTGRNDSSAVIGNYVINNVCLKRLDCVAFISPPNSAVVNNRGNEAASCITFRNLLPSTSYGFLDSGYGYQYDQYNDVNRWIPLNGHMAGLCARTDSTNAPWWSPAGYNRGILKNIIKLAWSPSKPQRDSIFSNQINPVITQNGFGTLLLGDATLLDEDSAFTSISVRRLFIVLEVAISTMAKFYLFEFNDAFTQQQFVSTVTPYLQNIKNLRGVTSFAVIADSTNNTAEIVDNEDFIGDIYIVSARQIRDIQLNFVASPDGVAFSEIEGQFGG